MQVASANALPLETIIPAAASANSLSAPDGSFLQIIQSMQDRNGAPVDGLGTNRESPAPGISTSDNAMPTASNRRTADFINTTASTLDGGPESWAGAASAIPATVPSRVKRSGSNAASQPDDQGGEMISGNVEVTSAIITPLLLSPEQNLPTPTGTSSDSKLMGAGAGDTTNTNVPRAVGDSAKFTAVALSPTENAAGSSKPTSILFSDKNPSGTAASGGTQLAGLDTGRTSKPADEFGNSKIATEAAEGSPPLSSVSFENPPESSAATVRRPVKLDSVDSLTEDVVADSKPAEQGFVSVKGPSEVAGLNSKQSAELVTVDRVTGNVTPSFKTADETIGLAVPTQRFADRGGPMDEIAAAKSPAKRNLVARGPSDTPEAVSDPVGPLSASGASMNQSVAAEETGAGIKSDGESTDKIVAVPGTRPTEVTASQETIAGRSDRISTLRIDPTVVHTGRDSSDAVSEAGRSKSYTDDPSATGFVEPAKPARDLPIRYGNGKTERTLPGSRGAASEPASDNLSSVVQQPKVPPQPHVAHQTLTAAGDDRKDLGLDGGALFHPSEPSLAPAASSRTVEQQDVSAAISFSPTGPSSMAPATGPSVSASQIHVPNPLPPMEQVKPALMMLTKTVDGANEMTLLLQPAELGRVQIRIARTMSGLTNIAIVAEKATTLLTLQKDQPQLHRTLDEAGIPAAGRAVTFHVAPAQPANEDRHSSLTGQRGPHGPTAQTSASADGDSSAGGSKGNHASKKQNAYSASGRTADPASLIAANGVPVPGSYRVGLDITA